MRRHFIVAAVALGAVAVTAKAQEPSRGGGGFIYQIGPQAMRLDMRRGRLGITVDLRPDATRDSVGARVTGVTPGGPADHAGVQANDVITRLNGTRLVSDARSNDDEEDQSRPGLRLINLASRLEAGDSVRLDVRRGTQNLTVSFVADRTDMDQVVERMRIPGAGTGFMSGPRVGPDGMSMPGGGTMRVMVRSGGLGELEMVKVTPALAEGLGITEGVLVTSVDSASTLGLRPGDVITAIGGRRPTDPVHAMRILGSYDPGESVSIDVMRQHRRTTVTGRIPDMPRAEWHVRPNNFEFNLPRVPGVMQFERGDDDMMRRMEELPRMMQQLRDRMPRLTIRAEAKV